MCFLMKIFIMRTLAISEWALYLNFKKANRPCTRRAPDDDVLYREGSIEIQW